MTLDVHSADVLASDLSGSKEETLDDRIQTTTASLTKLPTHPDPDSLAQTYADLSEMLYNRYTEHGLPSDIHDSLSWARKALALSYASDPKLPTRKSDVATCLESIHRLDGNTALIDEAIILQEEAIEILLQRNTSLEDELLQECRYNLCVALDVRFQNIGSQNDLERAIAVNHELIDSSGGATKAHPDITHQLGGAYYDLFNISGDTANLERSLKMLDQALLTAATEQYQEEWSFRQRRIQAAIARCLHRLYTVTGNSAYLTSSIQRMRDAMKMTPSDSVLWADYQSWLGAFLWDMYRHNQEPEYLREAIALERECLLSTPKDHPLLAWRLSNLGQSLRLQYEADDGAGDSDFLLSESIDLQAQAINSGSTASTAWWKHRLSETYLLRFLRKGEEADLREAMKYSVEAVDSYPMDHPEYTAVQMMRARILGEMEAEVEVVLCTFRSGLQCISSLPHMRMECALALSTYAVSQKRFKEALEGYSAALQLMPEVLWFGLEMNDRTVQMSRHNLASIAADAAACSLEAGNTEIAIELLEQGRSLLWSQAVSLDTDVSTLEKEHPDMALRFRKLSTQLRQIWTSKSDFDSESHSPGNIGDRGHRLFIEWRRVVDDVRALPGFDRFLRPPSFSDLKESAREGAVVVLNASPIRMDAMILNMTDPVHVITLPNVQLTELETVAYEAHRGRMRGRPAFRGRGSEDTTEGQSDIDPITWVWDNIVKWIVEPLKRLSPSERIWLCPTGFFTFLPLHAACPSDNALPGLADTFFISYTPTLTSLIRARRARENQVVSGDSVRILAIAQSSSTLEGFQVLDQTSVEIRAIAKHVDSQKLLILENEKATVQRVSSEMLEHRFVHFACHAHQDEEPMESSLHMHDGLLKMSDLVKMQLKQAEFAFLSCCETATGAKKMPDEAVHLAAALQYTGFQSIISTLWSIDDWTAPRVASAVYRELLSDGKPKASRGAVALGKAIRQLKKRKGMAERLVPYIHIGL
ncbi:hypothetical protein VNI00_009010 [Paramarasmius palmivorus]|uniref:CHAT domain-containing protein n=1 Tax=Paramarasmius palmivorus TaxID=297713 RepID=A0AAW0CRD5_9AGAR